MTYPMSIKIAVIGVGRMGKLHCRVLSELPQAQLVCVVDRDLQAAQAVAAQYHCQALESPAQAAAIADAAIVAVPTVGHIQAALPFVQAGKPVLIEKPIAKSSAEAQQLLDLAAKTGSTVQVGHTERFNPAVEALGRYAITPKFIEATRISPFTFRSADVGVVLDMMIHDIDLVLTMAHGDPVSIEAVGVNVIGVHEDIANARLVFANGCVANLTASRLAIKSERKMRIFSEQAYVSVDYAKKVGAVVRKSDNRDLIQLAREKNVKDLAELALHMDYSKLVRVEDLQVDETAEPLKKQAESFCRCVAEGAEPVVSGVAGLAAVRCAERIVQAIQAHRWDGDRSDRHGLGIIEKDG